MLGLLLSPAVRELLLARMSLHMNLQLPLLVACGAGLVAPWHAAMSTKLASVNRLGLSGWLLGTGLFSVWMVPRALDAAVADGAVDALKMVSLLLAGAVLALSWRSAGALVQAFFVGNTVWMTVTVGLLVAQAPTRLCNAYLEGDQRQAGHGLVLLGLGLGSLWLGLMLRRADAVPNVPLELECP